MSTDPDSSQQGPAHGTARAAGTRVPIRDLGPAFRPQMAIHLLHLDPDDRLLRFGYQAGDPQIRHYVDGIDFARDRIWGIFNRRLQLIAMAHLALLGNASERAAAEFGVSVWPHARGRGYGTLLFERAAMHASNQGVDTLHIHALSQNAAMLHIATRAGAVIEHEGREAEARVRLPEATFRSRVQEFVARRVGRIDYRIKADSAALYEEAAGQRLDAETDPRAAD